MKKKILILFKASWHWNKFFINKLSKFYEVEYLYLDQIKKNHFGTLSEINNFIENNKIEIVFFDIDYQKIVNVFFIRKIKNVKKVMVTWDDYERHNFNLITSNSCNFVVTGCPVSELKYKEIGCPASFMILESDGSFYRNLKLKKDIEVLFFGKVNKNRNIFLNFIKESGIKIKVVGNNEENRVSDEELVSLICRSKIVINFSKTTWGKIMNIPEKNVFQYQYQLKGRIIQSGLCGTACITEYAPHHRLLYKENELIEFNNKKECVEKIKDLLKNPESLNKYTETFSNKTKNFYEEEKSFQKTYDFLNKMDNKQVKEKPRYQIIAPYWYLRICAKQILLKNLKISKIFDSIFLLKEVAFLANKTNIFLKLMLFSESILNIIWFSIIRLLKTKGAGKNRYKDEYGSS